VKEESLETFEAARTDTRGSKGSPASEAPEVPDAEHATEVEPQEETVRTARRRALAVCAIGMALAMAFASLQDIAISRNPTFAVAASNAYYVVIERCLEAAFLVAIALFASRIRSLGSRTWVVVATGISCVALSAVGLVTLARGSLLSGPLPHLVMTPLKAIAPSLLTLLWLEQYARMDARRVMPCYLLATVLSAGLTIALAQASGAAIIVTSAGIAIVSVVLLHIARGAVEQAGFARGERVSDSQSFPAAPVVLMATFTLANLFARNILPTQGRSLAVVGVAICLPFLAAAALLPRGRRLSAWTLCDAAFLLALAGLFGLLVTRQGFALAASMCTYGAEALFGTFILTILCNISYRYGANALMLFGFSEAARSIAKMLAALLLWYLHATGAGSDSVALAVATIALCLSACYVVLCHGRDREVTWGVSTRSATGEEGSGGTGDSAGLQERGGGIAVDDAWGSGSVTLGTRNFSATAFVAACSQVAYEFGLTRREEQVMALVCEGMTAADIERELCVSNSTVKTHTHAVYQKLGVHGRQAVTDFMVRRMDEVSGR
jgi:DNA-binding CsgD family transcriptional regulator